MTTIFQEWEAGELTDTYAIRAIAMQYGEVESQAAPLLAERDELRAQLSRVVAHIGGKADVKGFGALALTSPSISATYDTKALDALVIQLTADGYGDIAQRIARLRKESARAGSLRITREK